MEAERFIVTKESAKYLGVTPSALQAWRSRGCGPPYHKFGSAVRYRIADLDDWAARHARRNAHEVV